MGLIHYENDFSSLIKDKAVVDFYATWCGPCKMFGPVFEDASKENDFNFIKLDVDKYSDIAREYGIMSIPTIILFENGKEVKMFTGFMNKEEFVKLVQNYCFFYKNLLLLIYDRREEISKWKKKIREEYFLE